MGVRKREKLAKSRSNMLSPPSAQRPSVFLDRHVLKNSLLILLSLICLPLSAVIILVSIGISTFNQSQARASLPEHESRKTILVTGVSMAKGIAVARLLSRNTPHRIIGADISPFAPGRFSRSLTSFHLLTPPDGGDAEPYVDSLLSVIRQEQVDLWISCSSVVAAVEDGKVVRLAEREIGAKFRAVQFNEDVIEKLHNKDSFMEYISSLKLRVPESYRCTDSEQVLDILLPHLSNVNEKGKEKEHHKKLFIMKPIGVDDRARENMMTQLPFSSAEGTSSYVKGLDLSETNPFQLQQYIHGPEYCTHALIVRGRVAAFVACPSSDLLMHYKALDPSSHLSQEMLAFTQRVASDNGPSFTGHLSFDFLVEGEGKDARLFPIECNPRAHTAVCLFEDSPEMSDAYLSVFDSTDTLDQSKEEQRKTAIPKMPCYSYYWIGHDLVTLILVPFLCLIFGRVLYCDVTEGVQQFWHHLVYWRDGTFTIWDPMPLLVLYHVYWPMQFLRCILNGRVWSRINVSTTKIFEC